MAKIQIIDLVVSVLLIGGAIATMFVTHNGAFEALYFVPYVLYEAGCVLYAKHNGWFNRSTTEDDDYLEDDDI